MAQRTCVVLAVLGVGACLSPVEAASTSKDYAVLVEATAAVSPPSITLSWPLESRATGYQISRKLRTDTTWGGAPGIGTDWTIPLATLPGTATSWTDNTVSIGVKYEYQILRTSTFPAIKGGTPWPREVDGLNSWGYICAGINVAAVDHRGTLILIVDDTMAKPLSMELARLQDDLVGDGWSVIRHDVPRGSTVTYDKLGVVQVKEIILNDYLASPAEVKSVFLFGHIPVPRAGDFQPSGHLEHWGAQCTDMYYADMHGVWTDTLIDTNLFPGALTLPPNSRHLTRTPLTYTACKNVPGDGKFDQFYVPDVNAEYNPMATFKPATVNNQELEIGRVDLWGLTSFAKSETELLRQYLDKDHNHRHAITVLPRRALISEKAGSVYGSTWWLSWAGLVGSANLIEGAFGDVVSQEYLGFFLQGAGYNNNVDTVSTAMIAQQDPKAAFWMMMGSHFCDWDYAENILRAPLATSTGLASVWSGRPPWYLHTMGMGGTTGEMARLNQNNSMLNINPWINLYNVYGDCYGKVHLALMGDPTLRLYAVKPVPAVSSVSGTDHIVIDWTASPDTVAGYYVYRSGNAAGPFARITDSLVTGTSFTDAQVPAAGTYTYMVRAIKLEKTPTGTYYNSGQGTRATATYSGGPVALAFKSGIYTNAEGNSGASIATITATRSGGSTGAVSVQYATANGTATSGSDYTATSGTLTWAAGDTADKTFTVTITGDTTVEADETVLLSLSNATGGATLGTANATLTITNDDGISAAGVLAFKLATFATAEGNSGTSNATITAIRTEGSTGAVSVQYAAADGTATSGSDYTATSGTLSWADGETTAKTLAVTITGDTAVEADETVLLTLRSPTGGATLGTASATLTITNDDALAGCLQFSAATYSVKENVVTATITVTRTGGGTGAVALSYATSNGTAKFGSDYKAASGTVYFADGDTADKTFTVTITKDAYYESDETVNLTLSVPTGGAILGAQKTAALTIVETDGPPAGTLHFSADTFSVNENGGTATISVSRSVGSAGAVSVSYATSNGTATAGSDYTVASGTVSFADGDTANKTFTVAITDDSIDEGNETINVTLSAPTGGAKLSALNNAVLTIVENDPAPSPEANKK